MRRLWPACALLVFALAPAPGAAADEAESDVPFAGLLPEPNPALSVNRAEEDVLVPMLVGATQVYDAADGRPLADATLEYRSEYQQGDEMLDPLDCRTATSDARGVVLLEIVERRRPGHWIVRADGYAPAYFFAPRPPLHTALRRSTDAQGGSGTAQGRLLDAMGRPVAGAAVEAYVGSPRPTPPARVAMEHLPAGGPTDRPAARTRTVASTLSTKDGAFALPSAAFSWCAVTPSGRFHVAPGEPSLGRRMPDCVLTSGSAVRGRIVDAKGKPVAGVVVRDVEFGHAPVAITDADGRFELAGMPEGAGLQIAVPGAERDRIVSNHFASAPFVVVLDADGAPASPDLDAKLRLRVNGPDGKPMGRVAVRLTRASDGWSTTETTADDEGEPPGTLVAQIPAGSYELAPASAFESAAFPLLKLDVPAGAPVERTVPATAQPSLAIRGTLPPGAAISVATASGERSWDPAAEGPPPHLPAAAAAVVRVQPVAGQRVVFFFPVGPAQGAVRTAELAVPAPHRITVAGAKDLAVEHLSCDGIAVPHEVEGSTISTYAEGPMVLNAQSGGERRRLTFTVPAAPGAAVPVEWGKAAPRETPPAVRVTCTLSDGSAPQDVKSQIVGGSSGMRATGETTFENPVPCRLILRLEGHQSFDRYFTAPGDVRLVWGACALRLVVTDDAGAPAKSIVQVDDVLHWTKDGVLELKGLGAGPHRVVVCPVLPAGLQGRELRVVLKDGETRTREVKLPKR